MILKHRNLVMFYMTTFTKKKIINVKQLQSKVIDKLQFNNYNHSHVTKACRKYKIGKSLAKHIYLQKT